MKSAEEDAQSYTPSVALSLSLDNPCLPSQYHSLQLSPAVLPLCPSPRSERPQDMRGVGASFQPPARRASEAPALESPRIEITAYGQFPEEESEESSLPAAKHVASVVTLSLPHADGYRNPGCLSPASSASSRSCHSDASSYESGFSYNYDHSPQNSPWQSPCASPRGSSSLGLPGDPGSLSPSTSPRTGGPDSWMGVQRGGSRPSSPGKRKYSFNGSSSINHHPPHPPYTPDPSPGPSPHTSPRLSITEESWLPNTNQYTNSAIVAAINALTTDVGVDLGEGIPLKARRTGLEAGMPAGLKVEPGRGGLRPEEVCQEEYLASCLPLKKEGYCGGFLDVPQPYSWSKPKHYLSPSLPGLDWQLPSSMGSYSLQILVQPKSHHRAHYETEGSRGAVKAMGGGHPVVQLSGYEGSEPLTLQLFIGTADDRLLRPHAFYQVHRITGKTVSTASHETQQAQTKLLELPLLPENNMRAVIDCAGILKLRNSDIELRKGETDIGRKNTRVRMVFRVHITQPSGRTLSLQAASNPIECSQRSAQELPLVDKQSLQSCAAPGGEMMLLSGHNFHHHSKVVFLEKAQDGHHLWETEAKVDKDSSISTSLLLEVPPYRKQSLSNPVLVNFYVCNGKRKRSQYQSFTYVSANIPTIKMEPLDDFEASLLCASTGLAPAPKPPTPPQVTPCLMSSDLRPCLADGPYSACQQRLEQHHPLSCSSSPSTSPKLHPLSPSPFSQYVPAGPPQPRAPPSPTPHVSIIQETPGRLHPPGSASSPASQPSSPAAGPERPLSSSRCPTAQPGRSSPVAQLVPRTPEISRLPSSLHKDGSPPSLTVSVKQEPQELDQMYLDDVNEIIRNDLSSNSVQSSA
ncbi:nuclear factor of activated T-cells, cytoplasmic 1 [Osmerus mordax]|uniref:nuclear factor of activated T-cells, cytoplasmic 1 n=1 Tax=Osmerus mordax TaxID=8014 RepID=UPI0035105281